MTPCKKCGAQISEEVYFCPQCGEKLKDKAPATTFLAQLGVYAVNIFFPPFGLWSAWKYWIQPDQKSKNIAIVALILTIASLTVNIWLAKHILGTISTLVNLQLP